MIGIDRGQGIWIALHPEVLLDDHPELWEILDDFLRDRVPDLDPAVLSYYELEAWAWLRSARARREARDRDLNPPAGGRQRRPANPTPHRR